MSYKRAGPRNHPIPHHGRSLEIPRREGSQKLPTNMRLKWNLYSGEVVEAFK